MTLPLQGEARSGEGRGGGIHATTAVTSENTNLTVRTRRNPTNSSLPCRTRQRPQRDWNSSREVRERVGEGVAVSMQPPQ